MTQPQPVRILHLTLKKKWFDLIASGEKKIEYREIKPYWEKRFFKDGKIIPYTEINFRNGYSKYSPFMRVEWLGCTVTDNSPLGDMRVYAIHLGNILYINKTPYKSVEVWE